MDEGDGGATRQNPDPTIEAQRRDLEAGRASRNNSPFSSLTIAAPKAAITTNPQSSQAAGRQTYGPYQRTETRRSDSVFRKSPRTPEFPLYDQRIPRRKI